MTQYIFVGKAKDLATKSAVSSQAWGVLRDELPDIPIRQFLRSEVRGKVKHLNLVTNEYTEHTVDYEEMRKLFKVQ